MNRLTAQPAEEIPDIGPKHDAAAGTWFLALVGTLLAGLFVYIAFSGSADTRTGFTVAALVFATLAAWPWVRIGRAKAWNSRELPRGHYLLIEHLKFTINRRLHETAITAFFRPDQPGPGGGTCLLIFLENYSSRRRHVRISPGTCAALDLPRGSRLDLIVLPGQAAVYRWPLRIYPDAKPGDYDLRLRLAISAPNGPGRRLPARSGKKYGSDNTLVVSSAALQLHPGFTVTRVAAADARPLAAAGYFTLASPAVEQPRFNVLRQISENTPGQPVQPDSDLSTPPWPAGAAEPPVIPSPACPP